MDLGVSGVKYNRRKPNLVRNRSGTRISCYIRRFLNARALTVKTSAMPALLTGTRPISAEDTHIPPLLWVTTTTATLTKQPSAHLSTCLPTRSGITTAKLSTSTLWPLGMIRGQLSWSKTFRTSTRFKTCQTRLIKTSKTVTTSCIFLVTLKYFFVVISEQLQRRVRFHQLCEYRHSVWVLQKIPQQKVAQV